MGIFKACCGCSKREQDSEPYETARCTQSALGPAVVAANPPSPQLKSNVQKEKVKDVAQCEDIETNAKKEKEPTYSAHTSSQIVTVGSTAQLFSILEAQSFNPPLCSTKIGEGTPTKSLSLSAIETSTSKRQDENDYITHSLLTGEKSKGKFKSRADRPLRRMTISSPLNFNNFSDSDFDCSKIVVPGYPPLPKISSNESSGQNKRVSGRFKIEPTKNRASCTYVTCEDAPVRMSCISTSTAYSRVNAPVVFMEFAKAMAENDRAYEESMAKASQDEGDVELPQDVVDCKRETMGSVLSLTSEIPISSMGTSQTSLGDGYRLLDGSAKPLSPEETAEFYAIPPPNTPIEPVPPMEPIPKEEVTSPTAVKIRGSSAYFSAR